MRGCSSKAEVWSLAQRCKNILAANYEAYLYTVKADAMGSKSNVHGSKVEYLLKKGRPHLWIRENELHNVNALLDERASLSVCCPIPGQLKGLLKSTKKLPARVALAGDLMRLGDEKVHVVTESLKELISLEYQKVHEAGYSVSSILKCSNCKLRSEAYAELVESSQNYAVYRFNARSCSYIDGYGDIYEVDVKDVSMAETDVLAPLSEKLIDGINQSQLSRRALMLFCLVHFNANAQDALMLAIDRKGFEVLAKVHAVPTRSDLQYEWKEFRFSFRDDVPDIEAFCCLLVQMEEEALKYVTSFSGIS